MVMMSRPLSTVLFAAAAGAAAASSAPMGNATVHSARPAMHYFRQWFDASIAADLARDPGVSPWTASPKQEQLAALLPDPACLAGAATVDEELGHDGVHRAVLKLESGRMHFVASARGRALVVDPPMAACGTGATQRRLSEDGVDGDSEELLHGTDDPLVQDCMELFTRESVDHCGSKLVAEPISAKLEIVDGFEVRVYAKINRAYSNADPAYHKIICLFEPPGVAPRAAQFRAESEQTPEEQMGMSATVIMHLGICSSSTLNPSTVNALGLFEMNGGGGELSHTKGYRHVYDDVPKWVGELQVKSISALPQNLDLRKVHKNCFPGSNGVSVVRAQGACGSCWAFAAASSYGANVCIAGGGKEAVDAMRNRIEVSVQRIISCNPQNYGCKGGHAQAAGASIANHMAASEKVVPYKCGSGSSTDHFKVKSKTCGAAPWGGSADSCSRDRGLDKWEFGGVMMVNGEQDMMNAIAQGNTLYVSMTLHKNFMSHKRGVYNRIDGAKMGGHAMVALGYGKERSGQRYWIVLNSWGASWGDGGYINIARGENLGEIEENAAVIDGWPVGFEPPNLPLDQKMAIALSKAGIPADVNTVKTGAAAFALVLLGLGSSVARCVMAGGKKGPVPGTYSQVQPY